MKIKNELKPCQCCGCSNVTITQYKKVGYKIQCKNCQLKVEQTVFRQTSEWLRNEMIKQWNNRPKEDEILNQLKLVTEQRDSIAKNLENLTRLTWGY